MFSLIPNIEYLCFSLLHQPSWGFINFQKISIFLHILIISSYIMFHSLLLYFSFLHTLSIISSF